MKITVTAIKITLFIFGGVLILWSFVCFLGGPDGKIGSLESIGFGLVFLLIGGGVIHVGKIVGKTGKGRVRP